MSINSVSVSEFFFNKNIMVFLMICNLCRTISFHMMELEIIILFCLNISVHVFHGFN